MRRDKDSPTREEGKNATMSASRVTGILSFDKVKSRIDINYGSPSAHDSRFSLLKLPDLVKPKSSAHLDFDRVSPRKFENMM